MAAKPYTLKYFYDNKIIGAVNKLIGNSVSKTLTNISKKVLKFHSRMFVYLASQSGVINSGSAPTFDKLSGMTQPKYNQLGSLKKYRTTNSRPYDYLKRKQKLLGKLKGGFSYYLYTGFLEKYFRRATPLNTFGKPQIVYVGRGRAGSLRITESTKSGSFKDKFIDSNQVKMKATDFIPLKKAGEFGIDLYPKVKKITKSMRMGDYFTDKVAYRLDNYRGGKNRQFMPQYMKWWAEVKLKNLLKESK